MRKRNAAQQQPWALEVTLPSVTILPNSNCFGVPLTYLGELGISRSPRDQCEQNADMAFSPVFVLSRQASKQISTTSCPQTTAVPMSQLSIEDFKRTLAALDKEMFALARNTLCQACHPVSLRLDEILNSNDKSDFHPGTRDSTDNIRLATIDHVFSNYSECLSLIHI